jgi:hypothetical protein
MAKMTIAMQSRMQRLHGAATREATDRQGLADNCDSNRRILTGACRKKILLLF